MFGKDVLVLLKFIFRLKRFFVVVRTTKKSLSRLEHCRVLSTTRTSV